MAGLGAREVLLCLGVVRQCLLELADRGARHLQGSAPEAVVHPRAVAPILDDPGVLEMIEMPGCFGLRHLKDGFHVADAELAAVGQEVDDSKPRLVPESLVKARQA